MYIIIIYILHTAQYRKLTSPAVRYCSMLIDSTVLYCTTCSIAIRYCEVVRGAAVVANPKGFLVSKKPIILYYNMACLLYVADLL